MQLQSENRCTIIIKNTSETMQPKDRCNKTKEKYFISKYYLKTNVPKCA
jgi:hypothetical protein